MTTPLCFFLLLVFKTVIPGSKLVWGKISGSGDGSASPSREAEATEPLIGETKDEEMSPRSSGASLTLGRKHVRERIERRREAERQDRAQNNTVGSERNQLELLSRYFFPSVSLTRTYAMLALCPSFGCRCGGGRLCPTTNPWGSRS